MSRLHKVYDFHSPAHWRAGLLDRLEVSGAGIATPREWVPRTLANSRADGSFALAFDICAQLHWVRPASFELMRPVPGGSMPIAELEFSDRPHFSPTGLVIGTHNAWILVTSDEGERLLRFSAESFELLDDLPIEGQALDLCSDNRDGVWVLVRAGSKRGRIRHYSSRSRQHDDIELPTPLGSQGQLDSTVAGESLIVLDSEPQTPECITDTGGHACPVEVAWRVWSVPICAESGVRTVYAHPRWDITCDEAPFLADRLVVDCADQIYVVSAESGEFWTLSLDGEIIDVVRRVIPARFLPLRGVVAAAELVISGRAGIATLFRSARAGALPGDAVPTFISPALHSPDGVVRGWLRADLDADLPANAIVEVSVARADRKPRLVDEVQQVAHRHSIPSSVRLRQVDGRLSWRAELTRTFRGADWPSGQPLRFPLHEVDATHIWIRIRVYAAPGEPAPILRRLRVTYPNVSYLRYLPAVYNSEDEASAFLRRMLVVFESVLGDLETKLSELPENIHPDTAPASWLPFLLRWLGLPRPAELDASTQRALLKRAPWLIQWRGTRRALAEFLGIVVGESFEITDLSEEAAPWMLPCVASLPGSARLGEDSLVLSQQRSFKLGDTAIGSSGLGHTFPDVLEGLHRRSGLILIRLTMSEAQRERLEPLLRRYLAYFVPAHCRYRLIFVSAGQVRRQPRFDGKLRVQADTPDVLGTASTAKLPARTHRGMTLGPSSYLDDNSHLG